MTLLLGVGYILKFPLNKLGLSLLCELGLKTCAPGTKLRDAGLSK